MKQVLIIALLFTVMYTAFCQERNSFKANFNIGLGTGFPGLLLIDEVVNGQRFERKALPPLYLNFQYKFRPMWSAGYYLGFEYEEQSGTTTSFDESSTSWVTGLFVNLHLLRDERINWFDPYLGIAVFYYTLEALGPYTIAPSVRVGANFFLGDRSAITLNIGVGVALIELGFQYKLSR